MDGWMDGWIDRQTGRQADVDDPVNSSHQSRPPAGRHRGRFEGPRKDSCLHSSACLPAPSTVLILLTVPRRCDSSWIAIEDDFVCIENMPTDSVSVDWMCRGVLLETPRQGACNGGGVRVSLNGEG